MPAAVLVVCCGRYNKQALRRCKGLTHQPMLSLSHGKLLA
jgi:hypothetical protein